MHTKEPAERRAMPDIDQLPDSALVRASVLFASGLLPFSRATLWRLVKANKFPAPAKISSSITAWQVGAVRRWQAAVTDQSVKGQEGRNDLARN